MRFIVRLYHLVGALPLPLWRAWTPSVGLGP
jgi:hypothetical protein